MGIKHNVHRNYEEEVITIFSAFQEFLEDKQAHNLSKASLIDYEDNGCYNNRRIDKYSWIPNSISNCYGLVHMDNL